MVKILIFVVMFGVVAVTYTTADCLDKFGGKDKLVGKKYVADGRRSSRNIVVFNQNAAEVKESEMPDYYYRVIGRNSMVTLDYREGRVNLNVDDNNFITNAGCY